MRKLMRLHRLCCLLLMLPLFCIQAHAVHKTDGVIGRTEYKGNQKQLISARHESNNNVSLAFVYWDISAEDYSVYVAVKYMCDDVRLLLEKTDGQEADEAAEPETDLAAAVELSVNDTICATAYRDETFPGLDQNRYDAESRFSFMQTVTEKPDTNNFVAEIRLGLKYWMPYNSTIGIRIFDCSGNPSNYYTIPVNPSPTESTTETTTTKPAKTTTEKTTTTKPAKTTTEKTTTTKPSKTTEEKTTTSETESTATTVKKATAARSTDASMSATRGESVFLTQTPTSALTLGYARPETAATEHDTSVPNKTVQTTSGTQTTVSETVRQTASQTESVPVRLSDVSQAEPSATVSESETTALVPMPAAAAVRAIRMNHIRTVGIVVGTVLLTSAVLISVLAGLRTKADRIIGETPPDTADNAPDEPEPDDF